MKTNPPASAPIVLLAEPASFDRFEVLITPLEPELLVLADDPVTTVLRSELVHRIHARGMSVGPIFLRYSVDGLLSCISERQFDRLGAISHELTSHLLGRRSSAVITEPVTSDAPLSGLTRLLADSAVAAVSVSQPSLRSMEPNATGSDLQPVRPWNLPSVTGPSGEARRMAMHLNELAESLRSSIASIRRRAA